MQITIEPQRLKLINWFFGYNFISNRQPREVIY